MGGRMMKKVLLAIVGTLFGLLIMYVIQNGL